MLRSISRVKDSRDQRKGMEAVYCYSSLLSNPLFSNIDFFLSSGFQLYFHLISLSNIKDPRATLILVLSRTVSSTAGN